MIFFPAPFHCKILRSSCMIKYVCTYIFYVCMCMQACIYVWKETNLEDDLCVYAFYYRPCRECLDNRMAHVFVCKRSFYCYSESHTHRISIQKHAYHFVYECTFFRMYVSICAQRREVPLELEIHTCTYKHVCTYICLNALRNALVCILCNKKTLYAYAHTQQFDSVLTRPIFYLVKCFVS